MTLDRNAPSKHTYFVKTMHFLGMWSSHCEQQISISLSSSTDVTMSCERQETIGRKKRKKPFRQFTRTWNGESHTHTHHSKSWEKQIPSDSSHAAHASGWEWIRCCSLWYLWINKRIYRQHRDCKTEKCWRYQAVLMFEMESQNKCTQFFLQKEKKKKKRNGNKRRDKSTEPTNRKEEKNCEENNKEWNRARAVCANDIALFGNRFVDVGTLLAAKCFSHKMWARGTQTRNSKENKPKHIRSQDESEYKHRESKRSASIR